MELVGWILAHIQHNILLWHLTSLEVDLETHDAFDAGILGRQIPLERDGLLFWHVLHRGAPFEVCWTISVEYGLVWRELDAVWAVCAVIWRGFDQGGLIWTEAGREG